MSNCITNDKIFLDYFHLNEKISIRVYYFRIEPYYF